MHLLARSSRAWHVPANRVRARDPRNVPALARARPRWYAPEVAERASRSWHVPAAWYVPGGPGMSQARNPGGRASRFWSCEQDVAFEPRWLDPARPWNVPARLARARPGLARAGGGTRQVRLAQARCLARSTSAWHTPGSGACQRGVARASRGTSQPALAHARWCTFQVGDRFRVSREL